MTYKSTSGPRGAKQNVQTGLKRKKKKKKKRGITKIWIKNDKGRKSDRCIQNKNMKGLVGQDKHRPRQRGVTQGCFLFGPLCPSGSCVCLLVLALILSLRLTPFLQSPVSTLIPPLKPSGLNRLSNYIKTKESSIYFLKSKTRHRNTSDEICCIKMDLATEANLSSAGNVIKKWMLGHININLHTLSAEISTEKSPLIC